MKLFPIFALLAVAAVATTLISARADDKSKAKPATKAPAKMMLPRVESADLNGKTFTLPDDFEAPRTLLLIAFEREHQDLIDSWAEGLKLSPDDKDWFELPTVGAMSPMRQQFLDGAMRGGIKGENKRSRVITLYTDQKKFIAPLGKTKTDTIYAVVVTPKGEVLAMEEGQFDKAKAQTIAKFWRAK